MNRTGMFQVACAGLLCLALVRPASAQLSGPIAGVTTIGYDYLVMLRDGSCFARAITAPDSPWVAIGTVGMTVAGVADDLSGVSFVTTDGYLCGFNYCCGHPPLSLCTGTTIFDATGRPPDEVANVSVVPSSSGPAQILAVTVHGDVYQVKPSFLYLGNIAGAPTATKPQTFGQLKVMYR